jgi:uroporphyrinogen decarboxylase
MTVFPKGAHWALAALSHSEYDCISIDWSTSPRWAREQVGDRVALQGNLDPAALFADEAELRRLVRRMLDEFGCVGTIANLGHGMLPEHKPEMLAVFVDEVHSYSRAMIEKQAGSAKSANT